MAAIWLMVYCIRNLEAGPGRQEKRTMCRNRAQAPGAGGNEGDKGKEGKKPCLNTATGSSVPTGCP
jgi:hypothetical protein